MKKLFLIYLYTNNIVISNSAYFDTDGNRKTNDLKNLKYFFIVPIMIYIGIAFLFSVVYYMITKKVIFTFDFLGAYINYKISIHNKKYLW